MKEGAEDNLSATGLRKGHPQNQDEFENVVKRCQFLVNVFQEPREDIRNQ